MKIISKIFIVVLLFTLSIGTGYAMSERFNDSNEIPDWATDAVNEFAKAQIISGYENGNFGPNDSVTRAQLATILQRYNYSFLTDYSKVLMNYQYFKDTSLDYEVQTALALAIARHNPVAAPRESNDFALMGPICNFHDANFEDTSQIKKVISDEIPKSYNVYYCDEDIHYGGGYYVHHQYTGGVPGSGTNTGGLDSWYGPFAPNILLTN